MGQIIRIWTRTITTNPRRNRWKNTKETYVHKWNTYGSEKFLKEQVAHLYDDA